MPNFNVGKDFSTTYKEENNPETRSLPGYIEENKTTAAGYNEESISLPGHYNQEANILPGYSYDDILVDNKDEKKLLPSYSLSVDDESRVLPPYIPGKRILPSYDQICQVSPGTGNGNIMKTD